MKKRFAYVVYGEHLIDNGIMKNQVYPLLKELTKRLDMSATLVSILPLEYDKERFSKLEADLAAHNIDIFLANYSNFDKFLSQMKSLIVDKNVVMFHARAYLAGIFTYHIKKELGVPFIFDARGLMPEETRLQNEEERGYQLERVADKEYIKNMNIENILVLNSDAIVVMNETFADYYRKFYNVSDTLHKIKNFTDTKKFRFDVAKRDKIRRERGWEDKKIMVFSGNVFSPWYDAELLLDWYKKLKFYDRSLILYIMTWGVNTLAADLRKLNEMIKVRGLSKDEVIVDASPDKDIQGLMSASDIAVIPHKQMYRPILEVAQPIKYAEFLANGLPVLSCDYCSEIVNMTLDYPYAGFIAEDGKLDDNLVNNIMLYSTLTPKRAKVSVIAESEYTKEKSADGYEELYRKLLQLDKKDDGEFKSKIFDKLTKKDETANYKSSISSKLSEPQEKDNYKKSIFSKLTDTENVTQVKEEEAPKLVLSGKPSYKKNVFMSLLKIEDSENNYKTKIFGKIAGSKKQDGKESKNYKSNIFSKLNSKNVVNIDAVKSSNILDTCFVAPIFCPNDEHFNVNYRSIESIGKYFQQYGYSYPVILGGYVAKDEYWQKILELTKKVFPDNCLMFKFDDNYGKAIVVNQLVKNAIDKYKDIKYILTCDSDIIFKIDQPNMIERLKDAFDVLADVRGRNTGVIAMNLEKVNAHNIVPKLRRELRYSNEILAWSYGTDGEGIAGPSLFISVDAWKKVRGYPEYTVYGGHDGGLLLKMHHNNYSVALMESIFAIHDNIMPDDKTANWKNSQRKKMRDGFDLDYNKNFQEAKDFWKNYK